MRNRILLSALLIACTIYAEIYPDFAEAQPPRPEFQIGNFVVSIEPSTVLVDGQRPPANQWQPPFHTAALASKIFAGRGTTTIHTTRIAVSFRDVRLSVVGGKLVAESGIVSGSASRPNTIIYKIEAFNITIDRTSVRITPKSAKATVTVTVPVKSFSTATLPPLKVSSTSSSIIPDGSIDGGNFTGVASLPLKDSLYRLEISQEDVQSVRIGPAFLMPNVKPPYGIALKGAASREDARAFTFDGTVSPDAKKATLELKLNPEQPQTSIPEPGYTLTLKSGQIKYGYRAGVLLDATGSFKARLRLPVAVRGDTDPTLQIELDDIALDTDRTEALFHMVSIPRKLQTGGTFVLEVATNGAWVYFPEWHTGRTNSSYPPKPLCDDLFGFLGPKTWDERPGVTVLQGTLEFKSPQINALPPQPNKVKARISGALTLTDWGIVGNITSGAYSFVPFDNNVSTGETPNLSHQYSWDNIVSMGDNRPVPKRPIEPSERFQLAGLRVLDMRLREMRACTKDTFKEGSAIFHHVVHFPFPSFIDLEFEDTSVDGRGTFHQAKGPLATQSPLLGTENVVDMARRKVPAATKEKVPNPEGRILWAWKLPVGFADRGVTINFPPFPSSEPATVTVVMDTGRMVNGVHGKILSSELLVRPLYSQNSAIKTGLRFSAKMDSHNGNFTLTGWDQNPFVSNIYPLPGKELSMGFAARLGGVADNAIVLVEATSDPLTRPYDFRWQGNIQFPFFSPTSDTWQPARFEIKNLSPQLKSPPLPPPMIGQGGSACPTGDSLACTAPPAEPESMLRVEVEQLEYLPRTNTFTSSSPKIKAFDVKKTGERAILDATLLNMSSYTNAMLFTSAGSPDPTPMEVPPHNDAKYPDECGGQNSNKWGRRIIKDWLPSSAIRDLVCYSQPACTVRGNCGMCSPNYYYGTYEVRSRNCATLGSLECPETAIISVPKAKYYFEGFGKLDIGASELSLKSNDMKDSHTTVINIPSAQLLFSHDGRFIEGAFGATWATVAQSLPYEGDLRFKLDTRCGYFYFQGAGSFTYYVRFTGQTFLLHAPYSFLTESETFPWVSQILDELSIRASFASVNDLTKAAGLRKANGDPLDGTTVISGVLTTGGVSKGLNFGVVSVSADLGLGSYLYQFKDGAGSPIYKIGTFGNAHATGQIGFDYLGLEVSGETVQTMSAGLPQPQTLEQLEEVIRKSEFNIRSMLRIGGCASVLIGHCGGGAAFNASYSTRSGLSLGNSCFCKDCPSSGDCKAPPYCTCNP